MFLIKHYFAFYSVNQKSTQHLDLGGWVWETLGAGDMFMSMCYQHCEDLKLLLKSRPVLPSGAERLYWCAQHKRTTVSLTVPKYILCINLKLLCRWIHFVKKRLFGVIAFAHSSTVKYFSLIILTQTLLIINFKVSAWIFTHTWCEYDEWNIFFQSLGAAFLFSSKKEESWILQRKAKCWKKVDDIIRGSTYLMDNSTAGGGVWNNIW